MEDATRDNEELLPEAPATGTVTGSLNGYRISQTIRGWDESNVAMRLQQLLEVWKEMGVEAQASGTPTRASKTGKPTPSSGTKPTPPRKEHQVPAPAPAPDNQQRRIYPTTLFVKQGPKAPYFFVKDSGEFKDKGVIGFAKAFSDTGYSLYDQAVDKQYQAGDFGFGSAVIEWDAAGNYGKGQWICIAFEKDEGTQAGPYDSHNIPF